MISFHSISALRISLASPEQIRSWSSGEVTKAETINYRTLKPERDGLFCERIFGPTKDWTCSCNKYKRARYKGKVCEKCGVTITRARVRRIRMGHIELAAPVSHVWFARGMPSRMALLLDLSPRELDHVLSYTRYIVLYVDEEACLKEIQRVKAEIARLEASMYEEYPSDAEKAPQQEKEPVLAGNRLVSGQARQKGGPIEVVERSNQSWAGTGMELWESTEDIDRAEPPDTFPELPATAEEADEADDEWEVLFARASINERIRQLQRVRHDLSELTHLALLEVDQYRLLRDECSHIFRASIGAEAIQELLGALNLDQLALSLRRDIHEKIGASRTRAIKRLKIVEAFRHSHANPQWMILSVIPVLPAELRPVLQLDGGRFATSDVNELYCRVIHRNNRLKLFIANGAPDLIIHHEKQMLQAACDALFDNLHCKQPLTGSHHQPLRSLTDSLRGKSGRFRHNLLGKRVDYSGRSVISVGLDLKLHQCGLPKKIALELFKPFIIHKLLAYDIVQTPRQAKREVERRHHAVWDILEEVMRGRLVLLNRAPTLHRLSIQAFEPILVEGNAIRLHPQVCSAFNADFDGDQMAVHLPLSKEAQEDARELMLSTHNLLSPASGEPSISVSQEQVLGCYYLTQERPGKKGEGHIFTDANEAIMAYSHGVIDLQARIIVRIEHETIFEQPPPTPPSAQKKGGRLHTTVGRLLFNEVLPKRLCFRNYAMKKDHLKQIVWDCIKVYGEERAAVMADAIKCLGFSYATKAGISFAISDVTVPPTKKEVLASADEKIRELQEEWSSGLITKDELHQQTIEIWHKTTDEVAQQVQAVLDPFGSVSTIANSGATKAKLQQIRQLSGMRGLMASPSGAIIDTPVRGNFLEGLSMAEYFISSHGARKSLMDRSLNTAEAGYLTNRFVNVAQDVIVTEEDCGAAKGLFISDKENAQMGISDSRTRLIGRILAESLPQVELSAGDELNEAAVERILAAKISPVCIRSVLACQAQRGVCRKCYGWDLSKRALVQPGTAVGIIAAQSIGEPGTQLTMRTFHSGGIAGGQGDITQGLPRVEELFEGRVPKELAPVSEIDGMVEITKDEVSGGQTIRVISTCTILDEYPLPQGSMILLNGASDRKPVQHGDIIAALPTAPTPQERLVRARLVGDLFISSSGILTICTEKNDTRTYNIPAGRTLTVRVGQQIQAGEPLTVGALNPQDILRYRGREDLERYLLGEAQRVYRTTGAYIHDKHFEIIIRQMLRYVRVEHSGDTDLLPEDLVDRFAYMNINARTFAEGGEPAIAHVILLGLTRAALATQSWLAAASFQQTSRVLTDAALAGQTDYLVGLKENVILGRLIPAGTGILPRPAPPRRKMPLKNIRVGRKRRY
jgi:DNA-directed RNA polymerase subunit beta'